MKKNMYKRTTIWLPIEIHTQVKIMAVLTETSFSDLIRISLMEKMKKLKEDNAKKVKEEN